MRTFLCWITVAAVVLASACTTLEKTPKPTIEFDEGKPQTVGNKMYEKGQVYKMAAIAPGAQPASDTAEAGLWMLMNNAEKDIKSAGNLVRDEDLNRYIRGITCKLAGPYCSDIRVYLLQVPEFNAMLAPNGIMVIWTGTLLRITNEAQLAAVIGHELSHYIKRHSAKKWEDMRTNQDVLAFFKVITAGAGFGIVGGVASLGVYASNQAYSREQEREADDLSLGFMVEGGYDPEEAPKIWDQLIREKQVSNDGSQLTLFASHPELEERRETLTHKANEMLQNRLHGQLAQDEYQTHILPHRNDFLREELNLRRFARTEVLLDMLIKNGVKRADTYFFLGEFYRLRDQKGDAEKAVIAYQQAIEFGEPPPETFRSLGMCHLKSGADEKARDAFTKYLKLKPNAVDRDVINQML